MSQSEANDDDVMLPGESAEEQPPTLPDDDAAIAAGRSGGTHKVVRPRRAMPVAKVERPDTQRPPEAPVNAKTEMPYAEAMRLHAEGKLERSVLTEKGWVAVVKPPPAAARAGVA